jgi:hypothetical protein
VSMTLGGIIYQSGIPVSSFTGVYTAQFVGMSYQRFSPRSNRWVCGTTFLQASTRSLSPNRRLRF